VTLHTNLINKVTDLTASINRDINTTRCNYILAICTDIFQAILC